MEDEEKSAKESDVIGQAVNKPQYEVVLCLLVRRAVFARESDDKMLFETASGSLKTRSAD